MTEGSHIGIHVRDLARSLAFYRDELGMEVIAQVVAKDASTREIVDLPEAVLNLALLRFPGTTAFMEIIEYKGVPSEPVDTSHANPGTCHIAFYVDDLDELYARLASKGSGLVSRRVVTVAYGPLAGAKVVYVTDPDGIRVEFLETDLYLDLTRRGAREN